VASDPASDPRQRADRPIDEAPVDAIRVVLVGPEPYEFGDLYDTRKMRCQWSRDLVQYNFSRIHQTTRVTPAMAAGVADHPWEVEEIVGLLKEEAVVILR
jgi:hypothetical protein